MKNRIKGSRAIIALYKYSPKGMRRVIEEYLTHVENGWYFSETLRIIYKNIYGLEIGMGSYGCFVPSHFPNGTKIGNYCSIGRNVTVFNANHPYQNASTHPLFYDKRLGASSEFALDRRNMTIGHDVWIGQDVIITKKCNYIGNGAIIGAGSIVTKNVESYSIVVGNPARVLRMRFDEETINELEESAWYYFEPQKLAIIAEYINKPMIFAKKAKELSGFQEYNLVDIP